MTDTARPDPTAPAKPLLREQALIRLRRDIVEGRLSPGARLTERELCETLGVSRTIAREVVRQLEVERLIEVVPHRGLRVARLTPRLVREVYDVREELEVLVVRAFLATATDAQIDALRARFDTLMDLARRGDRLAIADRTTDFMGYMVDVAGHTTAGEILGQLNARINRLRMLSLGREGRMESSVLEFSDVVDRIRARDRQGAELAVRMNVRGACEAALLQLGAAAPPSPPR